MLGLSSELSGGVHLRLSLGLSGWLLDRSVIDLELLDLLSDLVDSGILLSGDHDLAFSDGNHVRFQGLLSDGRGLSRGLVDCISFFDRIQASSGLLCQLQYGVPFLPGEDVARVQ